MAIRMFKALAHNRLLHEQDLALKRKDERNVVEKVDFKPEVSAKSTKLASRSRSRKVMKDIQ